MSDDDHDRDFRAGDGPQNGVMISQDVQLFLVRHGRLCGRVIKGYVADRGGFVSGVKTVPCGAATLAPDWEPWGGARYRPGEALIERCHVRFPTAGAPRGR